MLIVPGFEDDFSEKFSSDLAPGTEPEEFDVSLFCKNKIAQATKTISFCKLWLICIILIGVEYAIHLISYLTFITENGVLISRGLDEPSELTVKCVGDKLHIYYKLQPRKSKPNVILKNTPKNHAAVERFIDCEPSEENEEFAQPPEP